MRALLLPLAVLLASCTTPPGASRRPAPAARNTAALRDRVAAMVATHPGAQVAVYYRDLGGSDSLAVNADISFHAASTMKVPVMIALFRQVDAGTLSLAQAVPIRNTFRSLVDGTAFSLDSSDDSDVTLYRRIGGTATLGDLDSLMIERSSNLATNLLLALLDPARVTATAHALGARNIAVLRGVEDQKAFDHGLNNTTTARDLGVLLAGIERGTAAAYRSCAAMTAVLLRQEFNTEIPAGIPAGVPVAHKTGWITGTLHDAAIVYPAHRPPYVLVVLTRGIASQADARALIAGISRDVYGFNTSR